MTSAEVDDAIVAVVQLESQDRVGENLERACDVLRRARRAGATLALLPENFAYMGAEEEKRSLAETVSTSAHPGDGPILSALREVAKSEGLYVIAGGMPERSDDPERPYNTSVVLTPAGTVSATYRKVHLFDVEVGDGQRYRESAATSPGDRAVVADVGGLRTGLSVCYDLRFPELYRALVDAGAVALTVPAAFTLVTGKDHWHVLLRARAIENGAWVLAAAQGGAHPRGRRTYGKSCVVDPWGDVVAQASEGPGFAVARVDRARVDSVRASLPCLAHRRALV